MPVRITGLHPADFASIAHGRITLPRALTIEVTDHSDLPCDLLLDVRLIEGRYEVTRLEVRQRPDGQPIDSDTLRALPIRQTIAASVEGMAGIAEPASDAGVTTVKIGPGRGALEEVARIYAVAYAVGLRPTKAVAERFDLPPSTASKRVMAARKAGLLPPARPGKAGAL